MAKKLSSDVRVYYGQYDLSPEATSIAIALAVEPLDPTALQDSAERALSGLRKDTVEYSGLFDDSGTGMDAAQAALTATGTAVFSVLIGTGTGDRAYAGTAYLLAAKSPAAIADLVKQEAVLKPDQAWDRGVHFGPSISKPSSAQVTSGTLDNAALSTAGGVGYFHIFAVSSGTINCNFQESAIGTTWTSILSGTLLVTEGTSARLPITGTIQRYTRVSLDGTGIGTAMGILVRS